MRTIVFSLLLAALAVPAARADAVDDYVRAQLAARPIPGAALAVVRDGKVVKAAGYGFADLEPESPAAPRTVWEIGSMTKQFTAVAVMMLVEAGTVALDDPVTRYFPDAPAWWGRITVRHLLTHTSGLRNHVAVPGFLGIFRTNLFFEDTPSRAELLGRFYELPREFEPGATWAYDNTGYHLLGAIVEQASGKGYFDFLAERIFRPLGMSATTSTDPRPLVLHRASGYDRAGERWENRRALLPPVGFSAGSLLSTVEDLARWDAALSSERLLRRASLETMWTPARAADGGRAAFDYGFGWFLERYGGRRDVLHGGGTPGFSSTMHRFVDDRLTVILLTNRADVLLDQAALDVAELVEPALRPATATPADPALTAGHRDLFARLLAGTVDPERFSAPMLLHLRTATGKGFFEWYAAHGELGAFTPLARERDGDSTVHRYRVALGPGSYRFSFRLAADGRIEQIVPW
jgi:CubicO group peptidase (beta-lactamase class C family)